MNIPFVDCVVEDCDARDGEFFETFWHAGFCAYGADEGVPAICYFGIVEESEIERDEGAGFAPLCDAFVDGFCGFIGG